jgi:hypothetical protein
MPNGKFVGRMRCTGDSVRMNLHHGRARDADVPEGQWHGSHPPGSRYDEASNGELSIYSAAGDLLCTYPPGKWRMHEDSGGVHVAKLGPHNPFPEPETPERIDVQDSEPVTLAKMNKANANFWRNGGNGSDADPLKASNRALHSGIIAGAVDDTSQNAIARLRALNLKHRQHDWLNHGRKF